MKRLLSMLVAGLLCHSVTAQDRFADVKITAQPMAGSVHMLTGSGGNIGVSAGEDGILIIDDQYAPLAERIAAAMGEINAAPARYVINTHYHGDHTGGNAWFHENHDATIFAHENVRVRLAGNDDAAPASLPVVTYDKGVKFHFNDETIHVMHLPAAHTDGDSLVWFEQPDVLHTGDLFFNGLFPFIDLNAGGTVEGYINSTQTMLEMITDDTKIIPGHGPAASKSDLEAFLVMMSETYNYVQKHKMEGMSVEQLVEKGLEAKWQSWNWRFITEERWIKTLY